MLFSFRLISSSLFLLSLCSGRCTTRTSSGVCFDPLCPPVFKEFQIEPYTYLTRSNYFSFPTPLFISSVLEIIVHLVSTETVFGLPGLGIELAIIMQSNSQTNDLILFLPTGQ